MKYHITIETEFTYSYSQKFHDDRLKENLKKKALKLYNKISDAMSGSIIANYNNWHEKTYPDFNGKNEQELAHYDDGLSGEVMRYVEKHNLHEEEMYLVRADLHTATYTFFDKTSGTLVAMRFDNIVEDF